MVQHEGEQFYYEYKEGDDTISGVIPPTEDDPRIDIITEHNVTDFIHDELESHPSANKNNGEFVGLLMLTPVSQLDNVDQYEDSSESPYTISDWEERLKRQQRIRDGEDTIEVEL